MSDITEQRKLAAIMFTDMVPLLNLDIIHPGLRHQTKALDLVDQPAPLTLNG